MRYFHVMKVSTILIAILSLWLSTQPCCADEVSHEDGSLTQMNDTPSDHTCGNELPCSPFYSCRGCVGFSVEKIAITLSATLDEPYPVHFTFWHEYHTEAFPSGLIKPPGNYLA